MLHGLASTPKEFGMLTHPLRRLGLSIECPSIPSYSHGAMDAGFCWQGWVDAATEIVENAAVANPEPFVLGGLCTGAMLALAVAGRVSHPRLRGLALLSPLVAYNGWGLPWWYGLRRLAYGLGLARHFSMSERPPFGLKNERMRQWVRQQMTSESATVVGPASVPLTAVRESERLSRQALKGLAAERRPLLVLHAQEDEICNVSSVLEVFQPETHPGLQLQLLQNSYHMITADNDRQEVAQALADFALTLAPQMSDRVSNAADVRTHPLRTEA
jgi:carboxylesterase